MRTQQCESVTAFDVTRSPARMGWRWTAVLIVILGFGGAGGAWFVARGNQGPKDGEHEGGTDGGTGTSHQARVQVIKPERGGMERVTSQPGTIRAFEYAPLFTKVSGFVKTLNVDRGSRVKKGELLAEIYDPERDVAVIQGAGQSRPFQSNGRAGRGEYPDGSRHSSKRRKPSNMRSRQLTTRWSRSVITARKSTSGSRNWSRAVRSKRTLKDEQLDEYHSSEAALLSAEAGIETAVALLAEAKAKVEQAKADKKAAEAQVEVSAANLEMAKVFVQYTHILSPYDGIVIYRGESVHPGSFVRAADDGSKDPLLTVAMVAKMRTIVPIPDREVPYCNVGDPATVVIDALGSRSFAGKISRVAESEDINDRTMRARSTWITLMAFSATACSAVRSSSWKNSSRT